MIVSSFADKRPKSFAAIMEKFQDNKTLPSDAKSCVSLLLELQNVQDHSDTELHSGDRCVSVHSAILRQCSKVFAEMISPIETKVVIFPMDFSNILSDFVSLIYTGQAPSLTNQIIALLKSLCADLGIECSVVTENADTTEENHAKSHSMKVEFLKVETAISCDNGNSSFSLRMPVSRVDQSDTSFDTEYVFLGFKGRVQEDHLRALMIKTQGFPWLHNFQSQT